MEIQKLKMAAAVLLCTVLFTTSACTASPTLPEISSVSGEIAGPDVSGGTVSTYSRPCESFEISHESIDPVFTPSIKSDNEVFPPMFATAAGKTDAFTSKYEGDIHCIKIQTPSDKNYYLSYCTTNSPYTEYYPEVSSMSDEHAGSDGKPITKLQIHLLRKSDSAPITEGTVLLYRVKIKGAWLPWVSNANEVWTRSVQVKYGIKGVIDNTSDYAGTMDNTPIEGVEIRIFEEKSLYSARTADGKSAQLIAPYINQLPTYPTGCEIISAIMALNYYGYNITPPSFIAGYLEMGNQDLFDPYKCFGGTPYSWDGMGCYVPVVEKATNLYLSEQKAKHKATAMYDKTIDELCAEYIDNGVPVLIYATVDMKKPHISREMEINGKLIQWISPMHCLLLIGYDDSHYIFNDPCRQANNYFDKDSVIAAYLAQGAQSMVITPLE